MTDRLNPLDETWARSTWTQAVSIQDTPTWWRDVALIEERDGRADLAAQYRHMADTLQAALTTAGIGGSA